MYRISSKYDGQGPMTSASRSRLLPTSTLPEEIGDEEIAASAKALAHPARIRIVRMLLARQSCYGCDIVSDIGLAQSTISEHLRILKDAGVITGEIERPRVCYALNPESLASLAGLLAEVHGDGR